MSTDPRLTAAVAEHAAAHRAKDPKRISKAKQSLAAAKIEVAIDRALAAAPPLTAEQKRRVARLLTGGEQA